MAVDTSKEKEFMKKTITTIRNIISIVAFVMESFFGMIVALPFSLYVFICEHVFPIKEIDYTKKPWEREGNDKKRGVKVLDIKCPECECLLKRTWWRSPDESWEDLMGTAGWMTFCDQCKKTIKYEQVKRN